MQNKPKILSYGFELFIIIVSILFASYAWFTNNKQIKSDDLYIKTDSHIDLLVSLDGVTWDTETSLNLPSNFKFKNEITGDGVNFYVSSSKKDDGTPITFTSATVNKDYLEFDIWFKVSGNAGIFLQDDSYILPSTGTTSDKLIGTNVERISSSGNFSRDLIASSVRVAFISNSYVNGKYINASTPSLVWAPNKNYEISCITDCTANINSTNTQNYKFVDASENTYYYEKEVPNLKDEISASLENNSGNGDPIITYVNTSDNDGLAKVTVRIWIEGNDRDNVTALTGGMFIMNLNFTTITKQLNSELPVVSVLNNTINNYNNKMEYSVNNGLTWIKYEDEQNPIFNTGDTVYVRNSETASLFASNYVILEF